MIILKKKPTVQNYNYEELSSKYILNEILGVLDSKTSKRVIIKSMDLVQEVFFMCSRNEIKNDIKARQNLANTILLFRHYAFYLRGNCAIIGAGKMCSTRQGRMLLVSRPKIRGLNIFEKGSYTAKISGFSILWKIDLCFKLIKLFLYVYKIN